MTEWYSGRLWPNDQENVGLISLQGCLSSPKASKPTLEPTWWIPELISRAEGIGSCNNNSPSTENERSPTFTPPYGFITCTRAASFLPCFCHVTLLLLCQFSVLLFNNDKWKFGIYFFLNNSSMSFYCFFIWKLSIKAQENIYIYIYILKQKKNKFHILLLSWLRNLFIIWVAVCWLKTNHLTCS